MTDYKKELTDFFYKEDPIKLSSPNKLEYQHEAEEILKLLEYTRNEDKIPAILCNEFKKMFGKPFVKNIDWRKLSKKILEHPVLKGAIGRKL